MKRRLLSLLLVLSMCMSMCVVCAGTASATDWAYTNYTYYDDGTVETMCIGHYTDTDGAWAELYSYSTGGSLIKWELFDETRTYEDTVYTYDDNGNLLCYTNTTYNDDGSTASVYIYGAAGNIICYAHGDSSVFIDYSYSDSGVVLSIEISDSDGSSTTYLCIYSDSGVLLSRKINYADGSYCSTLYSYSDSGVVLSTETSYSNGSYSIALYDDNGYGPISTVEYDAEYGFEFTHTYNHGVLIYFACIYDDGSYEIKYYDDNGKLTSYVYYNSWTGIEITETYDTDGNVLETTEVDKGGKTTEEEKIENPFTDVQNASSWYYNAVMWAVEEGITNGTTDTTFSPTKDCTRAEIVTFLWRAAGCPEPTSTENPFTDVKSGKYYYKAVLWAVEEGITTGTSSTTFSPNASCTRAEAVTFIYRYAKSPSVSATDKFTDVSSSKWYTSAVAWAVENSITSGTSSTTFSPNTTCSRAMIVTFLYRYCA